MAKFDDFTLSQTTEKITEQNIITHDFSIENLSSIEFRNWIVTSYPLMFGKEVQEELFMTFSARKKYFNEVVNWFDMYYKNILKL
jgi:hypothetical protein